jgi:hypothetical protein
VGVALVFFLGAWTVSLPARALDKEGFCRAYTDAAVASARENVRLKCGFEGARYSRDRQVHMRWCLSVGRDTAAKETDVRGDQMRACRR